MNTENTDSIGMSENRLRHSETTELILKAFYRVYGELGYGFSEKVYENSTAVACRQLGLAVVQQAPFKVYFDGFLVGESVIDLLVNDLVIVELKAVKTLAEEHEAQLLNYLKATPCFPCLSVSCMSWIDRQFPESQSVLAQTLLKSQNPCSPCLSASE